MEVGFAKKNETKRKETFCKRIKDNGSRKDWQTANKDCDLEYTLT